LTAQSRDSTEPPDVVRDDRRLALATPIDAREDNIVPRVVPSDIVALIDEHYPSSRINNPLYSVDAAILSSILRLTRELAPELLTLSGDDYVNLIHGLAVLENATEFFAQRGAQQGQWLPQVKNRGPVAVIRNALAKCPDEYPSPATLELPFIRDAALRDSIRKDMSAATSSLHNGEWKGATVLAGAAAEALLLWKIQADPTKGYATLTDKPKGQPENWALADFINVAELLRFITPSMGAQARLAKDFRNLIHPGRAQRTGLTCDRATAYPSRYSARVALRTS
jgi:hypothetical protein